MNKAYPVCLYVSSLGCLFVLEAKVRVSCASASLGFLVLVHQARLKNKLTFICCKWKRLKEQFYVGGHLLHPRSSPLAVQLQGGHPRERESEEMHILDWGSNASEAWPLKDEHDFDVVWFLTGFSYSISCMAIFETSPEIRLKKKRMHARICTHT